MRRAALLASLILFGAAGATVARAQRVLVVDDSGGAGVDFTSLSAAVAAAGNGDVVLVRSGTYPQGFTIDGKSLVLAADAGASVDLEGGSIAIIRNLAATQSVTIRGLHGFATAWLVTDNSGTVWFEDCVLEFGNDAGPGTISATNSAHVVVIRCLILGLIAIPFMGVDLPSDALTADGCLVTLLESTLVGGSGDLGMTQTDLPGAEAVELSGSALFLGGSELTGGIGATEPGGAALLVSTDSQVALLDDVLVGGTGTPAGHALDSPGHETVWILPGPQLSFEIDSPRRVGESISLALDGPAGQQAWLLQSLAPGGFIKVDWSGVLLVQPSNFQLTALGTIPASGTLGLSTTVPPIAGLEALPIFLQGISLAPGSVSLASGSHLLLLAAHL